MFWAKYQVMGSLSIGSPTSNTGLNRVVAIVSRRSGLRGPADSGTCTRSVINFTVSVNGKSHNDLLLLRAVFTLYKLKPFNGRKQYGASGIRNGEFSVAESPSASASVVETLRHWRNCRIGNIAPESLLPASTLLATESAGSFCVASSFTGS